MSTGAIFFWILSWAFVIGLMTWSFSRILGKNGRQHHDPDGIGPAVPPVPGKVDRERRV